MSVELRYSATTRWRPSPTIAASIALHGLAAVTIAFHPETWRWALAALAANHAGLTLLGMWPRSTLLGPNLTRLPAAAIARREIALTFDDGPDPEVTPGVLDVLDTCNARATFFCIAEQAARHPELCREMMRRGHALENHSLTHSPAFAFLGLGGFRRDIASAQATLTEITGRPPRFFRAPAGLRNPLLDPVLHQLGLTLATWTRRGYDTREASPARIVERLTRGLAAGDILLLHDGDPARSQDGRPVVLEVLPALLQAIRARDLRPVTLGHAIAP
jgi:peptidoglycan/xylan/chitin deacetylase (PgdA/CDA1 family)